jgi:hypothetical protein
MLEISNKILEMCGISNIFGMTINEKGKVVPVLN